MVSVSRVILFVIGVALASAAKDGPNPLSQVIKLLESLSAKVTEEGEAEMKAYKEYMHFCKEKAQNLGFDIETGTKEQAELEATIAKKTSDIEAATSKIETLAGSLTASESELKDATAVREKEAADFAASEAELLETIDMLSRAIVILSREMAKNPASLAQVNTMNIDGMVKALGAVIDAAAFSSSDKQKLTALLQARASSSDADDDDEPGAPAVAAYKTHSASITEVLEDLKDKAEAELADLRKAEANAAHNYAMLKQSLEDSIAYETKEMSEEKADKAEAAGDKAQAESDLAVCVKALAEDKKSLADTEADAETTTADHEASVNGTAAELSAIKEAKTVLLEKTGGAEAQEYSFLQVRSGMSTRVDLANAEVVSLIKKLAKTHHSKALAQLASRVSAVIRYGSSSGDDPFAKVKGLITEMIERLQAEAGAEATEKAYCDENMAATATKKGELNADIEKLTVKIDQDASASAKLKEEVTELESELATLAKEQAEMDTLRSERNAAYLKAKADYTSGLEGVRQAMSILGEYYGASLLQQPAKPVYHTKATEAGTSIIEVLEVVESDFAKSLTIAETTEASEVEEYEKTTQENKVTKATKEQDVKYKTQEFTALDKTIAELTADRSTVSEELSAVLEFEEKLKERCIAKPETYESRKARRDAEIKGLKEALSILENETAFVQKHKRSSAAHQHFLSTA